MHSETTLPASSTSEYPQALIDEAVFNVGLGNNGYLHIKYMEHRLIGPAREAARRGLVVEHWGKFFSLRGWASWSSPEGIAERQALMYMRQDPPRAPTFDYPTYADEPDFEAMILARDSVFFD